MILVARQAAAGPVIDVDMRVIVPPVVTGRSLVNDAHVHTAHLGEVVADQAQRFLSLSGGEIPWKVRDDPPLCSSAAA